MITDKTILLTGGTEAKCACGCGRYPKNKDSKYCKEHKRKYPLLDKTILFQEYETQKLTAKEIGLKHDISMSIILLQLKHYGIARRRTNGRIPWNRGLTSKTDPRIKVWNKGKTKETDPRILYFSGTRFGKNNPNWRGGSYHRPGDYIYVRIYPTSPFFSMAQKGGMCSEHRLIMAKSLGRPLLKTELVHHKNGIRDDNKTENLEIVSKENHPKGYESGYIEGYKAGYKKGLQAKDDNQSKHLK